MCIEENVPIPRLEEADIDFGLDVNDNIHENENARQHRINRELVEGRRLRRLLIQNMFI